MQLSHRTEQPLAATSGAGLPALGRASSRRWGPCDTDASDRVLERVASGQTSVVARRTRTVAALAGRLVAFAMAALVGSSVGSLLTRASAT